MMILHTMARRRRGGFTLVEMLVVVGIGVVIAGIVFAAGGPMIAKSRQASCLNQLRSMGVALEGYLQDNNQIMPDMQAGRSSKSAEVPVLETVLFPYLKNADAFRCPADRDLYDKTGCSYFWNTTQNGLHVTKLSFFGIEGRPDKIPLISDKEAWHPDGTNFLYADQSSSSKIRFSAGQ